MDNNITRISDLPNGNNNNNNLMTTSYSPNVPLENKKMSSGEDGTPSNYMPINVHPNPYGISAQNPIMSPPQQTMEEYPVQQRLPSRDIPRETLSYSQDEEVQPNYIPKNKMKEDYVRKYEDMTEKNLHDYEEKNRKQRKLDIILTELQTPIFIAMIYFFFQMPIINTLIFKKLSFLSIYKDDGNFNFNGLLLKSIVFGSAYYTIQKITNFLVDL